MAAAMSDEIRPSAFGAGKLPRGHNSAFRTRLTPEISGRFSILAHGQMGSVSGFQNLCRQPKLAPLLKACE